MALSDAQRWEALKKRLDEIDVDPEIKQGLLDVNLSLWLVLEQLKALKEGREFPEQ